MNRESHEIDYSNYATNKKLIVETKRTACAVRFRRSYFVFMGCNI